MTLLLNSTRSWRGRGVSTNGNPSTFAFPYTPPDGINAYGAGSTIPITWTPASQTGTPIVVTTSAELTAALTAVTRNNTIIVEAGTYTGSWTLPAKSGTGWVWIVSRACYDNTFVRGLNLNPEGIFVGPNWTEPSASTRAALRVRPSDAGPNMPILQSSVGGNIPVFTSADHATWGGNICSHWIISGFEIQQNPSTSDTSTLYGIITLGGSAVSADTLPSDIIIDRCWIHAKDVSDIRRQISAQCKRFTCVNSWIEDAHTRGSQDNQCIAAWASPGPFKIVNNHLEATGENIIFGGNDNPVVDGSMSPKNILVKWNYIMCPLETNPLSPGYATGPYASVTPSFRMKNLYEHKNGSLTWIEGNVFDNSMLGGQVGYAILFQSLAQSNTDPSIAVRNIAVRYNQFKNFASGISMATPTYVSRTITNASNTSPIVITTSTAHNYQTGDRVRIEGVLGNTAANVSTSPTITVLSPTTFSIDGSSGNGAYISGGLYGVRSRENTGRIEYLHNVAIGLGSDFTMKGECDGKPAQWAAVDHVDMRRCTFNNRGNDVHNGAFITVGQGTGIGTSDHLTFDGVIAPRGNYGLNGDSVSEGVATLNAHTTNAVWNKVAFFGNTADTGGYTGAAADTLFNAADTEYLTDPAAGDFTVKSTYSSNYGADWSAVSSRTANVIIPAAPIPTATSTILVDTRAGGLQDIQSQTTYTEARAALLANGSGFSSHDNDGFSLAAAGDNNYGWNFVTNFDGKGTKAFRADMVGWGDQASNGYVKTTFDGGKQAISYFASPPTEFYYQFKSYHGRTVSGGGFNDIVQVGGIDRSSVVGQFSHINEEVGGRVGGIGGNSGGRKWMLGPRDCGGGGGGRYDWIWYDSFADDVAGVGTVSTSGTTATFSTSQSLTAGKLLVIGSNRVLVEVVSGSGTSWTIKQRFAQGAIPTLSGQSFYITDKRVLNAYCNSNVTGDACTDIASGFPQDAIEFSQNRATTIFKFENAVNTVVTHTLYVKVSSTMSAADGIVRWWANGEKIIDRSNVNHGSYPLRAMQYFGTTFRAPRFTQTEYFWDLLVWKP